MTLSNYPILAKITGCFALLAAVVAAALWFATSRMTAIDGRYVQLVEKEASALIAVVRANTRAYNFGRLTWRLVTETAEVDLRKTAGEVRTNKDEFNGFLAEAQKLVPNETKRIQQLQAAFESSFQLYLTLEKAVGASNRAEATRLSLELADMNRALRQSIVSLTNDVDGAMKKAASEASADTSRTISVTVWSVALGFASVLALSFAIVKFGISNPLAQLAQTMGLLANGNLGTVVEGAERRDEVGLMAKSVQVFKNEGLKARAIEAEARASREANERERAAAEIERAAAAAQQADVVERLGGGLASLAGRDLTCRLSSFPQDYKKLETDFNAAVDALRDTMAIVNTNSGTILSGAREISTAADDLSKRTEQQAASLEETAAALDEITATVKKAAEGALHARDVVSAAQQDAAKTGEVVQRTVAAMGSIEKSSQQISQIISVIDEIAFQTNLLALNAGVEAARAGDAGRGFAVVASEVRALAQRSAEAAKEIKGLISTSSSQVAEGVNLVSATGKALERILVQVSEINKVVVDISAGAQEQATGLSQVNTAINQMDHATQQNASMVEQSTAASHSLTNEASQLANLIAQFKIEDTSRSHNSMSASARPISLRKYTRATAAGRQASAAIAYAVGTDPERDWQDF